jgi:ABC-2 type transport system permease protein
MASIIDLSMSKHHMYAKVNYGCLFEQLDVVGSLRNARSCRAIAQVYLLALLLGVGISLNPLNILGVAAAIVLGAALFSTLSLIIACIVKTRERFMGIGQVLTMPIFFASNAIYPLSLMPGWLRAVSHRNPLTYEVDILRSLMLTQGTSEYGLLLNFGVLLAVTAVLTSIAARMYGRMGY